MVDKKNGGNGNDKDNVIPFPTKPKSEHDPQAIAIIVREVMDDLVGQLSPEQRKDFEQYLQTEKPDLADKLLNKQNYPKDFDTSNMELVGQYDMEQITKDMDRCETLFELCFDYIKNIEKAMFKMNQALIQDDLEELRNDLQKIWYDVQKKVDFD